MRAPLLHPLRCYRANLAQLQALSAENYLRASRLMRAINEEQLRLTLAGSYVELTLTEHSQYTTDMQLLVQQGHPLLQRVDMTLRLYHDMRLAEVITSKTTPPTQARNHYPNRRMQQPDEKWQRNHYFSQWLRHLERHAVPLNNALTFELLRDN